jgi:hypothetical protein
VAVTFVACPCHPTISIFDMALSMFSDDNDFSLLMDDSSNLHHSSLILLGDSVSQDQQNADDVSDNIQKELVDTMARKGKEKPRTLQQKLQDENRYLFLKDNAKCKAEANEIIKNVSHL